jgi:SAM-dependent methyltransferase
LKYFKNTELAKLYNVSEKSVRNWIESAKQERLDLQLYNQGDRLYIANTSKNTLAIKQLVAKGKKYKNSRGLKVVSPTPDFYATYNPKQIFDIISNLAIHREIPLRYSYVDGGAEYWDTYSQRLAHEEAPNMLTSTMGLLDSSLNNLDSLLGYRKQVNVVDLGPGNGFPVKNLLARLVEGKRLKRYIAIDVSREMLRITEQHIREWFGSKIKFEGHIRDFSDERFDDLFANDNAGDDVDIPVNLVLLLGGTLCNFRSPDHALQVINNSLSPEDLLVYATKLDTQNSRRHFDLGINSRPRPLDFLFKIAVDLLGIDESLYEVDQSFDEEKRARFVKIRPKVDLVIEFRLAKGIRRVEFRRNEPILLWRYWHQNALSVVNQFSHNDFELMHATKTNDQEYLLLVSKIRTDAVK